MDKQYRYWGNRNGGYFGNKQDYVLRLTVGEKFAGYYYRDGEYFQVFETWDVKEIERFGYMELAGDPFVRPDKPTVPAQQCKRCGDAAEKSPRQSVIGKLIRRFVAWLIPEGYQDKNGFHYGKPIDKSKK